MNTYIARLSDLYIPFSFVRNLTHIAMEPATNCVHHYQKRFFFLFAWSQNNLCMLITLLHRIFLNKIFFQYKYHVTGTVSFLSKLNEIFTQDAIH